MLHPRPPDGRSAAAIATAQVLGLLKDQGQKTGDLATPEAAASNGARPQVLRELIQRLAAVAARLQRLTGDNEAAALLAAGGDWMAQLSAAVDCVERCGGAMLGHSPEELTERLAAMAGQLQRVPLR